MTARPVITIDPDSMEGNIYCILGKAVKALLAAGGWSAESKEEAGMLRREVIDLSRSYEEAVAAIERHVEIKWKGGKPMM